MAEHDMRIPILMEPLMTKEWERLIGIESDSEPFDVRDRKEYYYGPNGRWLISAVLSTLDLNRDDEIAILTTSNETYVSTCVSVTAFNYCKISRVVTGKTRVIILIHEFGFVNPDVEKLVNEWKNEGIIVIEDCAHIIGYELDGKKVGSFGDYAIFSLPKIIPARFGGLLRAEPPFNLPEMSTQLAFMAECGKTAGEKFLSKYSFFNRLRIERYCVLKDIGKKYPLYIPSQHSIPFYLGFLTEEKEKIEGALTGIEWGATLRSDLVYIPTNPLVQIDTFKKLVNIVLNDNLGMI